MKKPPKGALGPEEIAALKKRFGENYEKLPTPLDIVAKKLRVKLADDSPPMFFGPPPKKPN